MSSWAVLVELALLGRVETDEGPAGLNGPKVIAVGDGPLPDPLLQSAYAGSLSAPSVSSRSSSPSAAVCTSR